MPCTFTHEYGWPRKRGGQHVQTCTRCGHTRESKVTFEDRPRVIQKFCGRIPKPPVRAAEVKP